MNPETLLGATALPDGRCRFCVWAPSAKQVEVNLYRNGTLVVLAPLEFGYHAGEADGVAPGDLYVYRLDGGDDLPDPASRSQPLGVHGPSQVTDSRFDWSDYDWYGIPQADYILYEIHVGTFTAAGTFDAVIPHLDALRQLGVTAIELMPIAEFPGPWNWGYDGAALYAPSHVYGGLDGFRRLVNASHQNGLAVVLDVVYNHAAPEGCYLDKFGPYFSKRYTTPWGAAFNFDGGYSDQVRQFFIQNALFWLSDCHVDALRLDAVDAILDMSAWPFLEELVHSVYTQASQSHRRWCLFAEDNSNNARFTRPLTDGGLGLSARWVGDFHHAIHTFLGSDQSVSRGDFGRFDQVVKAYCGGLVYTGEYSTRFKRRRGTPGSSIPAEQIVVFSQNHDQVANTETGHRSSRLLSFDQLKLLAGLVILSPYIPLLFMGEEYGEEAPFYFFARYSSQEFTDAVAAGRRRERNLQSDVPDPHAEEAFLHSHLDHALAEQGHHHLLQEFYCTLIRLRKSLPALTHLGKADLNLNVAKNLPVLCFQRQYDMNIVFAAFNLSHTEVECIVPTGTWRKMIASSDAQWASSNSGEAPPDHATRLESNGATQMTLQPMSMILYSQE